MQIYPLEWDHSDRKESMTKVISLEKVGITSALQHELVEKLGHWKQNVEPLTAALLDRHTSGDWGNVDPHDRKVNDQAVKVGDRLLSIYEIEGIEIWIISDPAWDRSNPTHRQVTTLLRREDY
jgi:hypothetical protein